MRTLIFVALFCGFSALGEESLESVGSTPTTSTRAELQFGFPGFFSLRLDRPVHPRWRVGMGVGLIPTFLVTPFFRPTLTQDISDDYNIVFDPSVNALSAGFYTEWQPFSGPSFLRLELLANIFVASASSYVVSKSTQEKAPYLNLDISAILPRLVLTYGTRLSKGESWDLLGGVGITLLITKQVVVQNSGAAAAYFEAVPTSRASIQDGMSQAETEIRSILSNTLAGANLLPALWISATW